MPYHGKIADVDQTARTFSIAGKEHMRVFKIIEATVITKDGNPATIADIVADEDVRLNGVIVEIDSNARRAMAIERIQVRDTN